MTLLKTISSVTGISEDQILGSSRKANVVLARQLYIYFLRKSGVLYLDIAKMTNRDSSTCHYSFTTISNYLEVEVDEVCELVSKIEGVL